MLYQMDLESEIVISGMSGRFPDSDNLDEFWQNLIDGKDMITNDHDRFKVDEKTMPTRMGVIKSLEAFDADFFGVHGKQSDVMDPRTRKLLEVSYEALLDAGVNPSSIRGTKTGVFVGGSESDAGGIWRRSNTKMNFYGVLGNVLSMMAGRLSFIFGFTGPSYVIDTACSASSVALQQALLNIRAGQCDAAIVAGAHLHHDPASTYMFQQLEMTSKDGKCKVFDASADGYVRAEAIVAIYICKKDVAKRSYATIVHAATNNDGYKEQGITFPSVVLQEKVIRQVYDESGVDPLKVDYLEAHGTGTKVGDPEEMTAVAKVFCEGREGPLLVGSVKSNMGHSEVVSGLCSIAKIILAHSNGIVPSNLHYNVPNPDIPSLHDGRVQIVDKNMPFDPTYVGMSSMGFGGTNVHVLFKMNPRQKEVEPWNPPTPLILLCSGRTQEAVEHYLQTSLNHRQNRNFVCLLHELTKQETPKHLFRGYVVIEPEKMEITVERQEPKRSMWYILPGLGSQWLGMSRDLVKFPVFAQSLQASAQYLSNNSYDLKRVFLSEDVKIFENLKNAVIPITAVQIALIDLLKHVGIEPDGIIGHSTGEVAAGYADGCLTQNQAVLVALGRARAVLESNCPAGTVASVGLTWEEATRRCPPGVYPVIHNAKENVTIAGPPEDVQNFVKTLESEGVFAKAVRSASFAFHSPMVNNSGPVAQALLEKIIPEPKERSKKWLSSSVPEDKWDTDLAKYCSPEYYVNNGIKPVYFYPALLHIPEQAIALEIAPHCFMQTILKQSLPSSAVKLGLIHCKSPDNCVYFLNSLGKCYLAGVNVDVGALYDPVQFPIMDNTPNISSMIRWDHSTAWDVPHHTKELSRQRGTKFSFHLLMDTDAFLEGHMVDDKIVFPATGYLWLVWTFFAHQHGCALDVQPVVFEDVRFERVTLLNKRNQTDFLINIFVGSGRFEIVESEMVVCTGIIRDVEESVANESFNYEGVEDIDMSGPFMNREDFYNEMHLRGYGHTGLFQGIQEVDLDANWAKIEWKGNWITFMDSMMQSFMLHRKSRDLCLPIRMEKLTIDPNMVTKALAETNNIAVVKAFKSYSTGIMPGSEVRGLHFAKFSQRSHNVKPITSENAFIPYIQPNAGALCEAQALESSMEIVTENCFGGKFVFTEIFDNVDNMISHKVLSQCLLNFMSLDFRTVNESEGAIDEEEQNKSGSKLMTRDEVKSCEASHLVFTDAEEYVPDAGTMIIPNGFVLYKGQSLPTNVNPELVLISQKPFTTEKHGEQFFILYRNVKPTGSKLTAISLDESDFKWVETAKKAVQTIADIDRLIFSSKNPHSGIVGFVRCLAREVTSEKVRCFHGIDSFELDFSSPSEALQVQIKKDLLFNAYKDGAWGTFNNVVVPEVQFEKRIKSTHAYANALRLGQLSSLCWVESPLKLAEGNLIEVHYAALNFRDIMLASGKLVQDALSAKAARENCVLGLEFSGVYKGKRVFGMGNSECLATHIDPKKPLMFDVPDKWTLAEAATVPTVYATVYFALLHKAKMEEGESILIHAGSGGVGQAAIAVALSMNCKVYTTVSTQEKRDFLKSRFPSLTEENFANSRDAKDFELHIYKQTNGKGVDLVLNSLAQDKLFASLRCLGQNGRFLEIGKFDVFNNTNIGLSVLAKGVTIYGIYADDMSSQGQESESHKKLQAFINKGIDSGVVIPLSMSVFKHEQLEEAFRYMAQGKHIGKVVIEVKEDENAPAAIPALPRTYFPKDKSYLIIGGLGGMGFELVDWMISRGAQKFVLASRSGAKSTYHDYHIRIWEEDGNMIVVDRSDASTLEGARGLIQAAEKLGPIGGIFNTALVLKDNLFPEQTPEAFEEVIKCKANATINLDTLSRKLSTPLDHFVVFSSIVAARGNPGQTNYGFANSVMERICEQRKAEGHPALAVQWGAVADVGVVHRTMKNRPLFGLDTQKLHSCLETLDLCLQQEKTVVSSFVRGQTSDFSKINPNDSLVNIAAQILGIKDLTKVNPKTPLVELGMDSLMAAELSQAMASKRNIQMSKKEYAQLNFEKLAELDKNKAVKEKEKSIGSWVSQQQQQQTQLDNLLKLKLVPQPGIVKMNSLGTSTETIFIIHPMDGTVAMLEPLASGLNAIVYGIECVKEAPLESLGRLAEFYLQRVKEVQPSGPYKISGYSFGASVAFEMVRQLEMKGEAVSLLLLLDSSPKYKTLIKSFKGDEMDKEDWENAVLLKFIRHYICPIPYTVGTDLHNMEALAQKYSYLARLLQETQPELSLDDIKDLTMAFKLRADCEKAYEARSKVKAKTVLLKALKTEDEKEVAFDYGLAEICEDIVDVVSIDGNHYCFYEKPSELGIAEIMNKIVG